MFPSVVLVIRNVVDTTMPLVLKTANDIIGRAPKAAWQVQKERRRQMREQERNRTPRRW